MKTLDVKELMEKVTKLLDSGDDEGCDGLVVVGRKEFMDLRKMVKETTGEVCGYVSEDDDDDFDDDDRIIDDQAQCQHESGD